MKGVIEQETLQALVETGAAREFRVLRAACQAGRLELHAFMEVQPLGHSSIIG